MKMSPYFIIAAAGLFLCAVSSEKWNGVNDDALSLCPIPSPIRAKSLAANLGIVLDASLGADELSSATAFLQQSFLPSLSINPDYVRVSVVRINGHPMLQRDFHNSSPRNVLDALAAVQRQAKEARNPSDLAKAAQIFAQIQSNEFGWREEIPTIALFVTGSQQTLSKETIDALKKLQKSGTTLAVIELGSPYGPVVGPLTSFSTQFSESLVPSQWSSLRLQLLSALACAAPPQSLNLLELASTNNDDSGRLYSILEQADKLVTYLVNGPGSGLALKWLAELTDLFGHRVVTSPSLNASIDYLLPRLVKDGFENVHFEAVTGISNWRRGREEATLLKPRQKSLPILGIGDTIPTPGQRPLTAQAIVVRSWEELDARGSAGEVRGKIVVYNQPWEGYGPSQSYRRLGGLRAARHGAVAALVRSVTPFSVASLHTGVGSGGPIPMACITVEDAELLHRMQQRGQNIQIQMLITSEKTANDVVSRDTVFEIVGSSLPSEVVLVSGHWDSWDVGSGAMDDGGGCAAAWGALKAMAALGLRPRRTIRAVLWGSEERGPGGRFYHNTNRAWGNETWRFVSESDEGAFKGRSRQNSSLVFYGEDEISTFGLSTTELIALAGDVAESSGVLFGVSNGQGPSGDVVGWEAEGVPGVNYVNRDTYEKYFTFHHTEGDTLNVLTAEDLDHTAAMWASVAWLLANA